jgi:Fe-S oxidoreductase
MGLLGESEESHSRVREAHETGAEILVTTCPSCMAMLDDAAKDEGLEDELTAKDIAELVKVSAERTGRLNCF